MGQCLFRILLEQMLGSRSSKNGHSLSNKRRKKRQMYNTMFFSLHVGTDEKNNGIIRRNKKKVEWPTTTSHTKKKRDLERLQKFVATPPPIWIGKNGHTRAVGGAEKNRCETWPQILWWHAEKGSWNKHLQLLPNVFIGKNQNITLCVCVCKEKGPFFKKIFKLVLKIE